MPPVTLALALVVPAISGVALAAMVTEPELRIEPLPVVIASGLLDENTNWRIAGEPVSPPVPTEAVTVPAPLAAALTSVVPLLFITAVAVRPLVSTDATCEMPP